MSKVSVVLTSYNHAKYLRESIESVLNQTFSDFELIIGDDASTDESWNIIQSYSDPRIHAYKHEVNQMGGIINELVLSGKISSDYMAINHSDDIWEPQKLEKQVAFLNEHPEIGAVFSNALIIGESGHPFEDASNFYYKIFDQPNRTRHEWLNYFFYHGNALCHPSILIRKACYDECGLYRYGLAQAGDFDMWVRLCLKYEIYVFPEKLVRFRVRSNEANSSGNRPEVRARGQFEYLQVLDNYMNIPALEEFIKVFPSAKKYALPGGVDIGFVLGMTALEIKSYKFTELFGLQLLFKALNNPGRVKKINEIYGFTYHDFIKLTGKHDVFSILWIEDLSNQTAAQAAEIENLSTRLREILNSKAWKVGLLFRRIRILLIPPFGRRDRILRKLMFFFARDSRDPTKVKRD